MSQQQIDQIFHRPKFDQEDVERLHHISDIMRGIAQELDILLPSDCREKMRAFHALREASAMCGLALAQQDKYK